MAHMLHVYQSEHLDGITTSFFLKLDDKFVAIQTQKTYQCRLPEDFSTGSPSNSREDWKIRSPPDSSYGKTISKSVGPGGLLEVEGSRKIDNSLLVETSLPWKSKTKQRIMLSMIHVKVSLLPIYAKFGFWTLSTCGFMFLKYKIKLIRIPRNCIWNKKIQTLLFQLPRYSSPNHLLRRFLEVQFSHHNFWCETIWKT